MAWAGEVDEVDEMVLEGAAVAVEAGLEVVAGRVDLLVHHGAGGGGDGERDHEDLDASRSAFPMVRIELHTSHQEDHEVQVLRRDRACRVLVQRALEARAFRRECLHQSQFLTTIPTTREVEGMSRDRTAEVLDRDRLDPGSARRLEMVLRTGTHGLVVQMELDLILVPVHFPIYLDHQIRLCFRIHLVRRSVRTAPCLIRLPCVALQSRQTVQDHRVQTIPIRQRDPWEVVRGDHEDHHHDRTPETSLLDPMHPSRPSCLEATSEVDHDVPPHGFHDDRGHDVQPYDPCPSCPCLRDVGRGHAGTRVCSFCP